MADLKITQLNNNTAITGTDLVVIVDDPGGTPVTEKRTVSDLFKVPHHIYDPNGNIIAFFDYSASAVNYLYIDNNATGAGPDVGPAGSDTNIDLNIFGKGTGVVKVTGGNGIDLNNKTLDNALRINYDRSVPTRTVSTGVTTSYDIDWSAGREWDITMSGSTTFTFSNAIAGESINVTLRRSAAATFTLPAMEYMDNVDGTTAPAQLDATTSILRGVIYYDGTEYIASFAGNYAVYS